MPRTRALVAFFESGLALHERYRLTDWTIPGLANLVIALPRLIPTPIPVLLSQREATVILTYVGVVGCLFVCVQAMAVYAHRVVIIRRVRQRQIAALLAAGFFSAYPEKRSGGSKGRPQSTAPGLNFRSLLTRPTRGLGENQASTFAKIKCLVHYFGRVLERPPPGRLSFHRAVLLDYPEVGALPFGGRAWLQIESRSRCMACQWVLLISLPPFLFPCNVQWETVAMPFSPLELRHVGTIEDAGAASIQVDFANQFIGGGVLGRGCLQVCVCQRGVGGSMMMSGHWL